jgi:hypothetical protein
MRNGLVLMLLFIVGINCYSQEPCDSSLFKFLMASGNKKSLTLDEFQKCKKVVDSLWKHHCYDYVKTVNEESYGITTLTLEFGKICIKANSDIAVNAYIDYLNKNKGSAEEQLSFSFENIFVKRPESVLLNISKQDSITRDRLLSSLAWGFVNNRMYGAIDPAQDDPFKAMTVYNNPPKPILNSRNYKSIYFSLNPNFKTLYPKYRAYIDYELSNILDMLKLEDEQK